MIFKILFISLLFFASNLFSEPSSVQFTIGYFDQEKFIGIPAKQSARWAFMTNSEKFKQLVAYVEFSADLFSDFQKATAANPATKIVLNKNKLTLVVRSFSEQVELTGDKGKFILNISLNTQSGFSVVDDKCGVENLSLRSDSKPIKFPLGISCQKLGGKKNITLSYFEGVELATSSIFENAGKGEPWRNFDLSGIAATASQLAEFTFSYKNTNQRFVLEQRIDSKPSSSEVPSLTLLGGIGYALVGINGADIAANDAKPSLIIQVPHYTLIGGLGAQLEIDFALPFSKTESSNTFFEFIGLLDYKINLGSSFSISPKAGYVFVNQINDSTQIGLGASQMGLGLGMNVVFSDSIQFGLSALTCKIGASEVIRSHYLIQSNLSYKNKSAPAFGVGIKYQAFNTVSELEISRNLSEVLFFVFVGI